MLKKLIKYDLISMLKFISIFYILGIVFAVLTRIFFSIENSFMAGIFGQITTGATISMLVSILINNLMRFWVRFKNTLYDDESYLIHTLPIDKKTIYLSKIITSLLIMLISFIICSLIIFVAYYSKENIEFVKNMLLPFANILNTEVIKLIIVLIFIIFIELFSLLLCGYLGIIIGHRFNNNKILKSVMFGFITYTITQLIVLSVLGIATLFSDSIKNVFISNIVNDLSVLKTVSIISIFSYIISIILNVIVSIKIFKKGVNVD